MSATKRVSTWTTLVLTLLFLAPACGDDGGGKAKALCEQDGDCAGGACFAGECYTACTAQDECTAAELCISQRTEIDTSEFCVLAADYSGCGADADCADLVTTACEEPRCDTDRELCAVTKLDDGSTCTLSVDDEGVCSAGECVAVTCTPICEERACGDDGCGGSCGTCDEGYSCQDYACEMDACVPDCEGKECGEDGCGELCGVCAEGEDCEDFICEPGPCVPDCEDKECGDDGCGEPCGSCDEGESCQDFACEPGPCIPDCDGKECGDDGCGEPCGVCDEGEDCEVFTCEPGPCVPDCDGKACGDDGCGDVCGDCPEGIDCVEGACVAEGPCDGAVDFPDAVLAEIVRTAINKPDGDITAADLSGLTTLNANNMMDGAGIADLTGLECAKNLNTANLASNAITNVAALSGLSPRRA